MHRPGATDRFIIAAALLAVTIPCASYFYLRGKIQSTLEPALATKLGVKTTVEHLGVSGAGELQLTGVHSKVFSAERLDISFSLPSILRGQPEIAHVRVFEPTFNVSRKILAARQSALLPLPNTPPIIDDEIKSPSRRRLPPITIADGTVRLLTNGGGVVVAEGVRTRPGAGGIRVTAENVHLTLADPKASDWKFALESGPISMDFQRNFSLRRLLAPKGMLSVSNRDNRVQSRNLALHFGIEEDGLLGAEVQIESDVSSLSVQIEKEGALRGVLTSDGFPSWALSGFASLFGPKSGTLSGRASFSKARHSFVLDADIRAADVEVFHSRLSSTPITVDGSFSGRTLFSQREGRPWRAAIKKLAMNIGGVRATLDAEMSAGPNTIKNAKGSLALSVPRQSCSTVERALTQSHLSQLEGLDATGIIEGDITLDFDPFAKGSSLSVGFKKLCQIDSEASGADPNLLKVPAPRTFPNSPPNSEPVLWGPGQPGYVAIRDLPKFVPEAFRLAEDGRFFQHAGFDTQQIARSIDDNFKNGRIWRGGSTITQQLAKNVFLSNERTFARKIDEAILAWRLEENLSKSEILEHYLNLCELGDRIFGIEAGAEFWFGKPAKDLNPIETGFLVSLVPAPQTITRRILENGVDDSVIEGAKATLSRLKRAGLLKGKAYREAQRTPLYIRDEPVFL